MSCSVKYYLFDNVNSYIRLCYLEAIYVFFKDSIKQDIDSINSSDVKDRDICNYFHYVPNSAGKDFSDVYMTHRQDYSIYNIVIWEFKDLSKIRLDDIAINPDVNLDSIQLEKGEILNSKSDIQTSIIRGYSFKNMGVNLNTRSTLQKEITGINYKGFYGIVSKMSLINEDGKTQIFFNFFPEQQTLLLFYKGHQSFFLIIINCNKPFDESIIKILNLN